jgi:uncharacterized protein YbbK (DUF523 family)
MMLSMDAATKAYLRAHEVAVGVSACLLGDEVRYDGGHKRHYWLVGDLGHYVTWVRVCPEAELGLGVPREPIDLVRAEPGPTEQIALLGSQSGRDLTTGMQDFAAARVEALASRRIAGYVLKSRSPSCGLNHVDVIVHKAEGVVREPVGRGLFAAALTNRFPAMPVVEEQELDTETGRDRFVANVIDYHRQHSLTSRSAPLPW